MARKLTVKNSLVGDVNLHRERECIDFLEERGFLIIHPIPSSDSITNIDGLATLFYISMLRYNKDRIIHYTPSKTSDRKYISQFLKSQKELGLPTRKAYSSCADIIKKMFEQEELLNLDRPIVSPSILTQKWVIDRVVNLINEESSASKEIFECDVDLVMDAEVLDEEFQRNISSNLDILYEKVVKQNGKEGKGGKNR